MTSTLKLVSNAIKIAYSFFVLFFSPSPLGFDITHLQFSGVLWDLHMY